MRPAVRGEKIPQGSQFSRPTEHMFSVSSWDNEDGSNSASTDWASGCSGSGDDDVAIEALLLGSMHLRVAPKPCDAPATATAAPATHSGSVELGFVWPYPGGRARPEEFPSKVGGSPVWLDPRLESLPSDGDLKCGVCSRRLRFLMQLYCPRPKLSHAHHRSVMLFCCGGPCLSDGRGWKARRVQRRT